MRMSQSELGIRNEADATKEAVTVGSSPVYHGAYIPLNFAAFVTHPVMGL